MIEVETVDASKQDITPDVSGSLDDETSNRKRIRETPINDLTTLWKKKIFDSAWNSKQGGSTKSISLTVLLGSSAGDTDALVPYQSSTPLMSETTKSSRTILETIAFLTTILKSLDSATCTPEAIIPVALEKLPTLVGHYPQGAPYITKGMTRDNLRLDEPSDVYGWTIASSETIGFSRLLEEMFFDMTAVEVTCWLTDRMDQKLDAKHYSNLLKILLVIQLEVIERGWLKVWNWSLILETAMDRRGIDATHLFYALDRFMARSDMICVAEKTYHVIASYNSDAHYNNYLPKFTHALSRYREHQLGSTGDSAGERLRRSQLLAKWKRYLFTSYSLVLNEAYRSEVSKVWPVPSDLDMGDGPWQQSTSKSKQNAAPTNMSLHFPTRSKCATDLTLSLKDAMQDITPCLVTAMSRLSSVEKVELDKLGLYTLVRLGRSSSGKVTKELDVLYHAGYLGYQVTLKFITNVSHLMTNTTTRTLNHIVPYFAAMESCLVVLSGLQKCVVLSNVDVSQYDQHDDVPVDGASCHSLPKSFAEFILQCQSTHFIQSICIAIMIAFDEILLGVPQLLTGSLASDESKPSDADTRSVYELMNVAPKGAQECSVMQEYIHIIMELCGILVNLNHEGQHGSRLPISEDQALYGFLRELRRCSYGDALKDHLDSRVGMESGTESDAKVDVWGKEFKSSIGSKKLQKIPMRAIPQPMDWHSDLMGGERVSNQTESRLRERLNDLIVDAGEKFAIDADPDNGIEEEYKRRNNRVFCRIFYTALAECHGEMLPNALAEFYPTSLDEMKTSKRDSYFANGSEWLKRTMEVVKK